MGCAGSGPPGDSTHLDRIGRYNRRLDLRARLHAMSLPLVVAFPDPRLARQAAIVESFDEALQLDARLLLDSLRTIPAIGLAGPHLGIMRRIIAIDLKSAGQPGSPHVYVNPIVTWCSTETVAFEEGSVSLPGIREKIVRPARVRVSWSTASGEFHEGEFEGFLAACLQHEIDQCAGIFWLDRLSRLKRDRALARFQKQRRNG